MKKTKFNQKEVELLNQLQINLNISNQQKQEKGLPRNSVAIQDFMDDLYRGKLIDNNPRNKRIRRTLKKL